MTAVIVAFVIHRTPVGNWIFAMGGDRVSARNAGIPTRPADRSALFILSGRQPRRSSVCAVRFSLTPPRCPAA